MKTFLKEHFPKSKKSFSQYFKLFYPMIIGSTLFALNGFVDNFMVGHIEQGGTALSTVNSWTNILMGLYVGTSAAGSVINARYYFAGDYKKSQSIFKFRLLFALFISTIFTIIAWIAPSLLIQVFLKEGSGDHNSYNIAFENSKEYLRIIAISWILMAITSQMGNSLREIGHGKASMYWGIATLLTNVTLNAILMYGFNFGVSGAAWASDTARIAALTIGIIWILKKDTKIGFKIWTIFSFNWKEITKAFFSKWYLLFGFSIATLFIVWRNFFYDAGYPVSDNSPLGSGLGAMSILALTGAIMNIFTTTFSATGSMAANIVGKELAKGNEDEAVVKAKELKGFITLVTIFLSIIMSIFATITPYMSFLSETQYLNGKVNFDGQKNLFQVRNSLYIVCLFYPLWIWFTASYRSASTGKKGFWFAFVDTMVSGPLQLGWLAALAYGIVPGWEFAESHFWVCYLLFFISDLAKLIFQEILFYKFKWNYAITHQKYIERKVELEDEADGEHIDIG